MYSLTTVYIVTAIISIIIASLLVQLARFSSQAKIRREREERDKGYLTSDAYTDESLRQTINEIVGTGKDSRELSKTLSDAFAKELEKRLEVNSIELNKKYEAIFEEKSQNEEIAWEKYEKVQADKRKTEAIIRSIAEGLVVVDAKGNVIMLNPAAEQLLGVSKKNKIGRSILQDLKKEQLVSLAKKPGDRAEKEIVISSQEDDTKKVIRSSTAVIENENGQTVGMVSVLSDVTKQKELDRMKEKFVASITHELRTPIVAVQKAIALLLSKTTGEVTQTQQQFLSLADRNLKKLNLLIDDLLDLSKLESGKMTLKCEISSIEKVIKEVTDTLNTWAKTKSITIVNKIQGKIPEFNIDPNRIDQVLTNLVGNAIKFTPENGKIIVEAVLIKDTNEVEVSVKDTGIGIEKENLPKVFDRFYQTGERGSTDISGTGVGLAIAKEMVELHKGKIWVESDKANWTKFIFRLPV